jgi:hypothetical protein
LHQRGPNQCKNDRDGTVSPNERLRITDTAPGIYDQPLDKPHDPLQIPAPASQLRRIGAFDGCAGNESISGAGNAWIWKCMDLEMHGSGNAWTKPAAVSLRRVWSITRNSDDA